MKVMRIDFSASYLMPQLRQVEECSELTLSVGDQEIVIVLNEATVGALQHYLDVALLEQEERQNRGV